MIWPRLKLIVGVGAALILACLVAGSIVLLAREKRTHLAAEFAALERSARAVETTLDRQLLQVHGALASLPSLLEAAHASPRDGEGAGQLLRGLNFQTLAFRDLLLVDADNAILAAARPRAALRVLPVPLGSLTREPTELVGPVRNRITGDWSLYVARTVPQWDGITPVAEVPLPVLMGLLVETGVPPGVTIRLERPDGQLLGAQPHDEMRTGTIMGDGLARRAADGRAFLVPPLPGQSEGQGGGQGRLRDEEQGTVAVVRASLHDDVRIVLTAPLPMLLATWRRDRDWTVAAAAVAGTLITAFACALLVALRQRERAEAERTRSAEVLANAVEAMSDGFAMWDEKDRLVTCNNRYRDLYDLSAPFLVPGVRFEEVVRKGAEVGQFPQVDGDLEAFVEATVAWHREGHGALERQLPDGRWLLMKERRTADGGIVGTRTDITVLKTTLADLGEAHARANAAVAEAEQRNAALMEQERRIRYLAHHDDLTGLPNRVLFRERVETALRAAAARGVPMALLYLDLDRFKDVNDTLGHAAGDALLHAVAGRLRACVADPECVARLSGDEFAVLSLSPAQPKAALDLSGRIVDELCLPYSIVGHTISVSASVGVAVAGNGSDVEALLKQADLALYQAKARGRGTVCVYSSEMDAHLDTRLKMEADLRHALGRDQLDLVYQPIYGLMGQSLCGFEALLRWRHPQMGLVSPSAFVPLAEETRLITEIGTWVLKRACADARFLPPHARISVNLSPVQLAFGDIAATVKQVLEENALQPERLELEITETALFADSRRNLEVLRQLRAQGVRIVLDDFGTGYSSLSHLKMFPLDKIKIDQSFIRDITLHPESAAIVAAIAALARRLGVTTTAEGVETFEQLMAVRQAGCTEAQGHFFGEPQSLRRTLQSFPCPLGARGGEGGGSEGEAAQ